MKKIVTIFMAVALAQINHQVKRLRILRNKQQGRIMKISIQNGQKRILKNSRQIQVKNRMWF